MAFPADDTATSMAADEQTTTQDSTREAVGWTDAAGVGSAGASSGAEVRNVSPGSEVGLGINVGPGREVGAAREVVTVYVFVCIVTALLGALRTTAGLRDAAHLGIAGLFLFVALRLARREPGGARRFGIDLGGLLEPTDEHDDRPAGPLGVYDLARAVRSALPSGLRETGVALGVAAVVFPPFVVGFWLWHQPGHSFAWSPPDDLASFALTQLVLVGLPEEALFRGYVQTRLHDRWPPRVRFLGAHLHPGVLVLQAALFALVHLATEPHPAKLAVFFPGLLFGWLRAWRGGIGAAIVFHALSNVLAEFLVRGWL